MLQTLRCRYFLKAFGFSAPIGLLAGLIGLGGGEFRLPVLLHVIGFGARAAVPLNLLVSLVTLVFALAVRHHAVPLVAATPYASAIAGLLAGGMVSAFYGARLVQHLTDRRLVVFIATLLAALGLLLIVEALVPLAGSGLLPGDGLTSFAAGAAIGLGVGLISSVLGVAGGELLIPALILVFGADIKIAGSASILISLAIVTTGLWRYHTRGALRLGRGAQRITLAMSMGSILGAIIGGLVVALAPAGLLKLVLGGVLIAAAVKTVRKTAA